MSHAYSDAQLCAARGVLIIEIAARHVLRGPSPNAYHAVAIL